MDEAPPIRAPLRSEFNLATLEHTTEPPATQDLHGLYYKSYGIYAKP